LVLSSIQSYNESEINGFGKTLRYSKLVSAIDNSQQSIVSNDTDVLATKFLTVDINGSNNYRIAFNIPIRRDIGQGRKSHFSYDIAAVSSSPFTFQDSECFFEDDGEGNMVIVREEGDRHVAIAQAGEVNYATGVIILSNVSFQAVEGGVLTFSITPEDRDIESQQTSILRVLDSDVQINVQQVRI
jgi:hypothetical protein